MAHYLTQSIKAVSIFDKAMEVDRDIVNILYTFQRSSSVLEVFITSSSINISSESGQPNFSSVVWSVEGYVDAETNSPTHFILIDPSKYKKLTSNGVGGIEITVGIQCVYKVSGKIIEGFTTLFIGTEELKV